MITSLHLTINDPVLYGLHSLLLAKILVLVVVTREQSNHLFECFAEFSFAHVATQSVRTEEYSREEDKAHKFEDQQASNGAEDNALDEICPTSTNLTDEQEPEASGTRFP